MLSKKAKKCINYKIRKSEGNDMVVALDYDKPKQDFLINQFVNQKEQLKQEVKEKNADNFSVVYFGIIPALTLIVAYPVVLFGGWALGALTLPVSYALFTLAHKLVQHIKLKRKINTNIGNFLDLTRNSSKKTITSYLQHQATKQHNKLVARGNKLKLKLFEIGNERLLNPDYAKPTKLAIENTQTTSNINKFCYRESSLNLEKDDERSK